MHSSLRDLSAEPSVLGNLTPEQREQLTDVLDWYLSQLDGGVPPETSQLLAAHPDLAEPLRAYLQQLAALHQAAAGFAAPPTDTDTDTDTDTNRGDDRDMLAERRLGDFQLGREIGRGGMGVVYEARQISLDRRVALKVLPFAAVLDTKQIARFKNEAQAAAHVQHPNIVPVYAIGAERGVHYYAMQLIEGQPLDVAISQLKRQLTDPAAVRGTSQGATDPTPADATAHQPADLAVDSLLTSTAARGSGYFRTVAELGVQAADALHAAHEYGVLHRDVKPSNLLLDKDGKLWITDFGLARVPSDKTLTRSGDLLGTLRYMSPEQALGKSALVDARADIYSLGITLYELLTLQAAFPGDDSRAMLRRIEADEPVRPRLLRPDLPADLETIVLKAISKTREDRYDTAQQLAEDLRCFMAGRPIIARPPTLVDQATKWARRHRKAVIVATLVGLLLLLGLGASTILIARANLIASSNFQRAQENYQAAREVVDLGSQVAERLASVPGAEQVRKDFLEQLLSYYQEFSRHATDDPSLRADHAINYAKIGDIQKQFGSRDEALAAFQNALRLLRELHAEDPAAADYRRQLALCQNNLGLLYSEMGDVQAAAGAYGQALALQDALVADFPRETAYRADLVLSQTNFALLQEQLGATAAAQQAYEKSLPLQQQLVREHPQDITYVARLAATYNNLASLFVDSDRGRAVEAYQQASRLYDELVRRAPQTIDYQNSLALTYNNLGSTYSRMGRSEAAEQAYRRAIELQTRLVAAAPGLASYQSDLALSYNNLGSLQSQQRRSDDAVAAFQRALSLQQALVAQHPEDIHDQSILGGIYNNLGIALQQLTQHEQAAEAFQRAVQLQQAAFQAAPDVPRYRDYLSKHLYNYGSALRELGQAPQAAEVALQRKQLWTDDPTRLFAVAEELALAVRMLEAEPSNPDLASSYKAEAIATLTALAMRGFEPSHDDGWPAAFQGIMSEQEYRQLGGQLKSQDR